MGKKRTKKQQEEDEEAEIQKSVGYYLTDAQLLLKEYFVTGNIETDMENGWMKFIKSEEDEDLFIFKETLYPLIQFSGARNPLVPSRYKIYEEYGGGASHLIFVSLTNFSIHLVISDGETRICRSSSTLLDLSSLIQAMPPVIFEQFMDYLCINACSKAGVLENNASLTSYPSMSDPRIVIVTECGEFNKAGYYAHWKFVRRIEPHMDVHFQFTEEQEQALVTRFTKLSNVKLLFINIE